MKKLITVKNEVGKTCGEGKGKTKKDCGEEWKAERRLSQSVF